MDETLGLLERGCLTVPDGITLEDFVAAGGKVPTVSARPEKVTARQLFDRYLATRANGTIKERGLYLTRQIGAAILVTVYDEQGDNSGSHPAKAQG